MEQRITLDNFEGPLDLLLHLVKREELDIQKLILSQITRQLLKADPELLVTASTLIWLKSEALLPLSEGEERRVEVEDPNFELIHHLADYCRFREAAKELSSLESKESERFGRGSPEAIEGHTPPSPLHHLSLSDLAALFGEVVQRASKKEHALIQKEEWSVDQAIDAICQQIATQKKLAFDALFPQGESKGRLIASFLALLELVKLGKVVVIIKDSLLYITESYDNC